MGFAVNFPLPNAFLRAELLQQVQQRAQSVCGQKKDFVKVHFRINHRRVQPSPPPTGPPTGSGRPTASDMVGVEDEPVRDDAAAGDEELVGAVVHDVVQSVDAHKHHVGVPFQIHQAGDLKGQRCGETSVIFSPPRPQESKSLRACGRGTLCMCAAMSLFLMMTSRRLSAFSCRRKATGLWCTLPCFSRCSCKQRRTRQARGRLLRCFDTTVPLGGSGKPFEQLLCVVLQREKARSVSVNVL